ncbi:hypothetical protein I4F81_004932 [Pyropia yezoensis]|uniref:Uncharacterized protein n=1 Tax=Pyropia yezoensis TaxID=2788 RepID=A0ACC3BWX1_PYRYE|nr:hypothetical protein I4F81_004932 [Neopyropia yezoensis]
MMGRYTRLTDEQRTAASVMALKRATNRAISEAVGAELETVAKVAERVHRTGSLAAPISYGRPPILGPRDRRRLLRLFLRHSDPELRRVVDLFNTGMPRPESVRTVMRFFLAAGVRVLRRRMKPRALFAGRKVTDPPAVPPATSGEYGWRKLAAAAQVAAARGKPAGQSATWLGDAARAAAKWEAIGRR